MQRIICHLDMDAFFASVEERYNPQFAGLPIVVGSDPKHGFGRGVVSTANYKAREYGIHSAMPITRAWQASQQAKQQGKPEAIFLPVDFELYHKSSANVLAIIQQYANHIEPASVDEFYFDLLECNTYARAAAICKQIKQEIVRKEKVTCSVGIGPNKLIAKIAAGSRKPDGLTLVTPNEIETFLQPLSIRAIPGIGPKTAQLFFANNIHTVKDLQQLSKQELLATMGKWGQSIYNSIRGIDHSAIETTHEAKSIGEQITLAQDTLDIVFLGDQFERICQQVFSRFRESGAPGFKTVTVTVRFSDFTTKTSSKSFPGILTANHYKKFQIETLKLLLPYVDHRKNPNRKSIRLIGARIENLTYQYSLMD